MTADDITTPRPAARYDPANPRDAHVLMPEYLAYTDKSEQVAAHCIEWLTDAEARRDRWEALSELRDRFATGGASERAAEYIRTTLGGNATPLRQAS